MSRHHSDLIPCHKLPGISIGLLCSKCDGQCVRCSSFVHPTVEARICDECNYGSNSGKCILCGGKGVSEAFYCRECVLLEHERDGCPRIINLGQSKADMIFDKKKYAKSSATQQS
jgi:hypothetical protein